jgi:tRNA threonylcarbamoyladenosine biosynthesis protein TsaE
MIIPDEKSMLALGAQLAKNCEATPLIFLKGELGAGKTTLVRGFLRALGHTGNVKSPTFTLVEPYELNGKSTFHFDLYRIHNPEELYDIGLEEYLAPGHICLIEWPENAGNLLPKPDLVCEIAYHGEQRKVTLTSH